jgi:hypothetical protein
MCGRFTYKLTWPEIVKLYRLSPDTPAHNPQARHNICPTTTVDTVIGRKGLRALVPMRWGLIPSWWSKPLKEMNLATFNARVETITDNPMFHKAFKHTRRLIPRRAITHGMTRPAVSSRTTLRDATARRSPSRACGTSGETDRRARQSGRAQ